MFSMIEGDSAPLFEKLATSSQMTLSDVDLSQVPKYNGVASPTHFQQIREVVAGVFSGLIGKLSRPLSMLFRQKRRRLPLPRRCCPHAEYFTSFHAHLRIRARDRQQ